jgi:hypothetical protein
MPNKKREKGKEAKAVEDEQDSDEEFVKKNQPLPNTVMNSLNLTLL